MKGFLMFFFELVTKTFVNYTLTYIVLDAQGEKACRL